MRRKFIYIGIILIIAGIATPFLAIGGGLFTSAARNFLNTKNFTVGSMSFSSTQIQLTNQSVLVEVFAADPVNIYIFNSSGFNAWTVGIASSNVPSGYAAALPLEGNGLLAGYKGTKFATVPYQQSLDNVQPFYLSNSLSGIVSGTYYVVVDNTNGSVSHVTPFNATILYPVQAAYVNKSKLAGAENELVALGGFAFVLLLAGIILVAYGFLKKTPVEQQIAVPGVKGVQTSQPKEKSDMTEEQIDRLYKKIGKKKKNRKS